MCSECRLHFSGHLYCLTKQEIEFFLCADVVSYFLYSCYSLTDLQRGDTLKASATVAYAQNIR